ncbi:hypothetical protein AB837_00427 [bacterium AB1]|nr:hypothetical protein AB837_00427 [bacterium AB1]
MSLLFMFNGYQQIDIISTKMKPHKVLYQILLSQIDDLRLFYQEYRDDDNSTFDGEELILTSLDTFMNSLHNIDQTLFSVHLSQTNIKHYSNFCKIQTDSLLKKYLIQADKFNKFILTVKKDIISKLFRLISEIHLIIENKNWVIKHNFLELAKSFEKNIKIYETSLLKAKKTFDRKINLMILNISVSNLNSNVFYYN